MKYLQRERKKGVWNFYEETSWQKAVSLKGNIRKVL